MLNKFVQKGSKQNKQISKPFFSILKTGKEYSFKRVSNISNGNGWKKQNETMSKRIKMTNVKLRALK